MIWWFIIIVTILISFKATVVLCAVNFEMIQNIDNLTLPLSKITILENGKNVSFSCKIVGIEITNNEVVWGKKTKGLLRFSNVQRSSNLNFTPITLKDRGIYFCASLKPRLYTSIYIGVKESGGFNNSSENRWKRENGNSISSNSSPYNRPLIVTMSPDWARIMKKKVVKYDTNRFGHETYSERIREYARVIAPLVAVTLIISTLLYYMMHKFYLCATYRARSSKTEAGCAHSACGHECMQPTKNNVSDHACIQEEATTAKKNEDAIIFLPFLFDIH